MIFSWTLVRVPGKRTARVNHNFLGSRINAWKLWWVAPDIKDPGVDPELAEAEHWAEHHAPVGLADVYPVTLDHARRQYEQMVAISDSFDKKADDLMRIAGVSAALENSRMLPYVVVSFVATVLISAIAKRPIKIAMPMETRILLKATDLHGLQRIATTELGGTTGGDQPNQFTKDKIEGTMAASYHATTLGVRVGVKWKAGMLTRATVCFCLGMVLVGCLFLSRPTPPSQSPPVAKGTLNPSSQGPSDTVR